MTLSLTREKPAPNRDSMIRDFIPMVRYLAQRISAKLPKHVEIDDLVNSGIIGLIDAIEKFDHRRGIKFKTYAEFRIRGAIFDGLRSLDWVPRSVRKQKKLIERNYEQLEQKLGRQATDEELSKNLGIRLQEYYKLINSIKAVNAGKCNEMGNFDQLQGVEKETAVAILADSSTEDPFHSFKRQEFTRLLATAIRNLPAKERYVVSLYYFDELTMKEIGTVLKITESRVSQLHTKSMARLRIYLKTTVKSKIKNAF